MKRPEIRPDNYEAVATFYRTHRPHRVPRKMLYAALGKAFNPEVHFLGGAKLVIDKVLLNGRTLALAANHVSNADAPNLAALVRNTPVLKPLVENCFILAKPGVFRLKAPGIGRVGRVVIDTLGGVPVFRHKDMDRYAVPEQQRRKVIDSCLDTGTELLNAGLHVGIFNEGERNREDPSTLQKTASGIGRMICHVSEREQPAVAGVGIWYGHNWDSKNPVDRVLALRNPTIVVSTPSDAEFSSPDEVREWLHIENKAALDAAIEIGTTY